MTYALAPVRLLLLLICLALPSAGWAEVHLGFYSREMGANNYPHAFVRVEGVAADGAVLDTNYGFTAKSVTPAILFGSVGGEIVQESEAFVAKSDRHFTLVLSDADYNTVLGVVERWRTRPQPSYNLNRANCIHFVGEVAAALGLSAEVPKALRKKPRSFLQHVKAQNEALIASRAPAVGPPPTP